MNLKRGQQAQTNGFPAVGGMPAVKPERVTIVRRAENVTRIPGDEWYVVRFDDGGRLTIHASRLNARQG